LRNLTMVLGLGFVVWPWLSLHSTWHPRPTIVARCYLLRVLLWVGTWRIFEDFALAICWFLLPRVRACVRGLVADASHEL